MKKCPFCRGVGFVCACGVPGCACDPKRLVECDACRPELVDVKEAARRWAVSLTTAHTYINGEKTGVYRMLSPGRKKPIVRVDRQLIDRILRRAAG